MWFLSEMPSTFFDGSGPLDSPLRHVICRHLRPRKADHVIPHKINRGQLQTPDALALWIDHSIIMHLWITSACPFAYGIDIRSWDACLDLRASLSIYRPLMTLISFLISIFSNQRQKTPSMIRGHDILITDVLRVLRL